jgi:iron(III) transport system ATP-binding protein
MAEPGAALVIEDLVKVFPGGVQAVDHVSLRIEEGQFATLLGPSGCGKTTTLNCIAGLETPDGGRIAVGDVVLTDVARRIALPPERRNLGMVFQSYALWPHMTVQENLAFGLKLQRVPSAEMRTRIAEALELVGLGGMEGRYPFQLSGGQQQRVALARAVVARPRLLLLDEPLSNLDAKVREQARLWLRELQQRLGITTVYVTHDQAEALAISDMVAVMSEGRLLQYAPPREIYERPASRFVADFIGQTSFLRGTVVESAEDTVRVRLASGDVLAAATDQRWQEGARVALAIRAERLRLVQDAEPASNVMTARIKASVYVGAAYQYELETPVGDLRAEWPQPVAGPEVSVYLPVEALVVLKEEE